MHEVERQARAFTYERQRLGGAAKDAATALRDVIAVYSSHPSAPLSLHARAKKMTAKDFHALDALRVPAMRGSIHLVPRENVPRVFGIRPERTDATSERQFAYFKVTAEQVARLEPLVLEAAKEPRSSAEISAIVGEDRAMAFVLGRLARAGRLLRIGAPGLRSNQLRWQAAEVPEAEFDGSLAWLAGEYFRAFGPARLDDFAWWAGTARPKKVVRAAVEALDTEDLGDGFLLLKGDRKAFEAARPPKGVDLLPKWDVLVMGYPKGGRSRFAEGEAAGRCYDFRGDGMPVVLVDGQAAGTWAFAKKKAIEIEVDWFDGPPGPKVTRALEARVEALRELLGGG